MRSSWLLVLLLVGCAKSADPTPTPVSAASSSATPAATTPLAATTPVATPSSAPAGPPCGLRADDWCPSPGDPCGAHKNKAECKADPKCKGMPYKGESLIACKDDGTGFASNCPTVGCISR